MARQRNCLYEKWLYHFFFFLACTKKFFFCTNTFLAQIWSRFIIFIIVIIIIINHQSGYVDAFFYFSESAVFETMIMRFKISFGSPGNLLFFLLLKPCVRYKARWATRWMICPYKCKWGRVCGRVSITTPLLWLLLKPTFGNQWTIWKFRRRQTSKY